MDMGCGFDIWRIYGEVVGHRNFPDGHQVNPSCPVSFDQEAETFKTKSGSIYKVMSYRRNVLDFWKDVRVAVKNGSYEVR